MSAVISFVVLIAGLAAGACLGRVARGLVDGEPIEGPALALFLLSAAIAVGVWVAVS